jgi:phage N-6-adenine-methyltransferase
MKRGKTPIACMAQKAGTGRGGRTRTAYYVRLSGLSGLPRYACPDKSKATGHCPGLSGLSGQQICIASRRAQNPDRKGLTTSQSTRAGLNSPRKEMTMVHAVLYASATEEWSTPRAFFDKLNRRYHFTLDPAATPENALCSTYFTKEDDGLAQDWKKHRVFCNPPYGRQIGKWAQKSFEAAQGGALVVLFVPARVDTRWFHDWVQDKAEIRFIRGRLRFGQADTSAPFPSMLAIYSPHRRASTCLRQKVCRTQRR